MVLSDIGVADATLILPVVLVIDPVVETPFSPMISTAPVCDCTAPEPKLIDPFDAITVIEPDPVVVSAKFFPAVLMLPVEAPNVDRLLVVLPGASLENVRI